MKKMNRKLAFMDIIFYMVIPYFIWNYGQSYLGDYFAMLLSTVPGFFYTIFRFWKEKQFNIGGLFIIGTLFIGTTVKDRKSTRLNSSHVAISYAVFCLK